MSRLELGKMSLMLLGGLVPWVGIYIFLGPTMSFAMFGGGCIGGFLCFLLMFGFKRGDNANKPS